MQPFTIIENKETTTNNTTDQPPTSSPTGTPSAHPTTTNLSSATTGNEDTDTTINSISTNSTMTSTPRVNKNCPNVENFLYDPANCDEGYWCGCSDPLGENCAPSDDLTKTNWAGHFTIYENGTKKILTGWASNYPSQYFQCPDTLYCPGSSNKDPDFCPTLCQAGNYCPTSTQQLLCPEGHYCLVGATEPTACNGLEGCSAGSKLYTGYGSFGVVMTAACIIFGALLLRSYKLKNANKPSAKAVLPAPDTTGNDCESGHASARRRSTVTTKGPALKIDVAFKDLQLTLPNGKCIMEGVSGELKAGSFCAIMGPSGAGKSTFLSLISGKNDPTGGKLMVNGKEQSLTQLRRLVGFVPQEDTMLRELTVYENICHAAMMRLPSTLPTEKKLERVEAVLQSLDLDHVRNNIIGDEIRRGISGGQRKRVNVAMELVSDPALICLDEPTSGLDSTSSTSLCQALRALARTGVNVSAVLHQPKTEIFEMFDKVLLLGVGGRTVYLGPALDMTSYFTGIGFPLPGRTNPADFYMDVVAGLIPCENNPAFVKEDLFELWRTAEENPDRDLEKVQQTVTTGIEGEDPEATKANRIVAISESQSMYLEECARRNSSASFKTTEEAIGVAGGKSDEEQDSTGVKRVTATSFAVYKAYWSALFAHIFSSANSEARRIPGFLEQTKLLFCRALLQRIREPANTFWPLLLSVFAGGVAGSNARAMGTDPSTSLSPVYYGLPWPRFDPNSASQHFLDNYPIPSTDNVVDLWQTTAMAIMLVCILAINVFGHERAVFFRDAASGTQVAAYWTAKTLETFLWLPLYAAVFSATAYAVQPLVISLFDFWLVVWAAFVGFYGIGGCASILIGLENRGIVTLVSGLIFILLFTGLLLPYDGKNYYKFFYTFWTGQAYSARTYEVFDVVFNTSYTNELKAAYDLDHSFGFNVSMAFVTGFAWHVLTLILLKVRDFRKQR